MANLTLRHGIGAWAPANRNLLDKVYIQHTGPWLPELIWTETVSYSDYSDADTSESLDLNATFTSNLFPSNVFLTVAWLEIITAFSGGTVSAATMILGDAGDDNGLITESSVFTGASGLVQAGGAESYRSTLEASYTPLLQLDTTGGNINTLAAGEVRVCIGYKPIRTMGG